jgi:carboxypeptidase C (cathepsin A)
MKSSRILLTLATACLLSYSTEVFAQGRPGAAPAAPPTGGGQKAGKEADLLPNEPVIHQKTGTFNGQTVAYTVEAGWIPIRDDGKVVAKMFYVSYTKNGVSDVSKRPLIISFNGGPGTASVWMHLGFTGPPSRHLRRRRLPAEAARRTRGQPARHPRRG